LALLAVTAWAIYNGVVAQRQAVPTYQTAQVTRGNLVAAVSATGPITSPTSLPLTFKANGRLAELDVAVGDKVVAGQVLAHLANARNTLASAGSQYDAAIAADNVALANAQKALDSARHQNDTAIAADVAALNSSLQAHQDAQRNLAAAQAQVDQALAADRVAV